ncbi:hypothetical protein [uncultured Metabacillus sp.]|uniref:hypothetical protein n=1 Tax=uncultured Metabacillus sp. TaxID=2860135 RepID=UPI00262AA2F8|nr:hypothetical protein [uncultured Metabacillus sp.]
MKDIILYVTAGFVIGVFLINEFTISFAANFCKEQGMSCLFWRQGYCVDTVLYENRGICYESTN